jgi:predicted PurR-regulated permease PerM
MPQQAKIRRQRLLQKKRTLESAWADTHRGSMGIVVLAGFVVVCAGIKLAAPILVPMVLGAFVATANMPLVLYLYRRRVPLVLTVVLALVADAVMLGGFSALLVGSAAELSGSLPTYRSAFGQVEQQVTQSLAAWGIQGTLLEAFDPKAAFQLLASLAGDIASALWNIVLALIIAAFLLFRFVNLGGARRVAQGVKGASIMGSERIRRAVREMYRYIAIKTGTSIITGLLVGVALWALDAELPILFGLLAFLLNYIPTLGSFVAALPAIFIGLLQHGVGHALLVTAVYSFVNVGIGNILEPRVMGRALGLWPSVVLLSVLFWGWMLGIVGAVLSALLTLAVKLILLSTEDLRSVGLALGPRLKTMHILTGPEDLLEEAMPQTQREPS